MELDSIDYITASTAAAIDKYMMEELCYPSPVLMEIAGQSAAHCFAHVFPDTSKQYLIICGPGSRQMANLDNGGDGLVVARHLRNLGYIGINVLLFKTVKGELENHYKMIKAEGISIDFYEELVINPQNDEVELNTINQYLQKFEGVADAIFGYSFKLPIRAPYDKVIKCLKAIEDKILSIDVPSGWDIEQGNTMNLFNPKWNISLMLPKQCMKEFNGTHFIGANFMNEKMRKKFSVSAVQFGKLLFKKIK